ncbi:hypothetical protein ABW19_dt0206446 [Dactylella cylindrospora]|nr:hypothetical protein ABW19_dt0206446 [Dactylella cylindrospora]
MAKSARASTKKASRSRIRNTVYAPVEQARIERLSARLMATISQPTTNTADQMEEDGKPITSSPNTQPGRRGREKIEKRRKRKALLRGTSRMGSALSQLDGLKSNSANMIAPNIGLDATHRQEQHTEDQAFKAAQQGNWFFDLPLPMSLIDEDSSGDESEDEAFYRAIGLFGDIQGFGMDNTLRVCLS